MAVVTVDQTTFEAIDLAARLTSMTHGEVVARLVKQSQLPAPDVEPRPVLGIYADYEGYRTEAHFHRLTKRIEILDGPLAGQTFKSPSSAARAVVHHYKPDVSPHRNGWFFWIIDDGTGRTLQSVRGSD